MEFRVGHSSGFQNKMTLFLRIEWQITKIDSLNINLIIRDTFIFFVFMLKISLKESPHGEEIATIESLCKSWQTTHSLNEDDEDY